MNAITQNRPATQDEVSAPRLLPLPIEEVRFGGEALHAAALRQALQLPANTSVPAPDPARVRRELMARSLLLSEGMAPAVYHCARACAARFGIDAPLEVFQSAGAENAAMHGVERPILLEIQGRLLSLLDPGALAAVVGHELGHYLAHGPGSPHAEAARLIGPILHTSGAPPAVEAAAALLSMSIELTADRFGLLACADLDAALRLEMVTVTGLPADSLTWDTRAYLGQSRALMEATLAEGETALGTSHPEHSLRAYAQWLFSESDLYRRLTGRGPGTRPIAQVDQELLRILGRPQLELAAADVRDEPPAEVHACALAACVLIAAADGEMHDSELAAIERVFAPLVAEWRTLLDPDAALAAFQRFGPLVAAAGPGLQRSLFTLLVHVLAADGQVHSDELATLLAIGGALGCRKLFATLLPPVLAQFGVAVEVIEACETRSIPMPPRTGEAAAALAVYLEGVAARGGDRVTLRRVLRLLGERHPTEALLAVLARALDQAGLVADPPFGEPLDSPHHLALTPAGLAARRAAAAVRVPSGGVPSGAGSAARRLTKGLTRLRDRLISGDGRSPAIRLYGPRTGRAIDLCLLEEVSQGLAERTLVLVRGGKRARLVEGAEIGGHEGARRLAGEAVALDREHRARVEESGAKDLFLGHPFLTGLVGGYLFRGPLILYPAAIERGGAQGAGITLVPLKDATPIVNQSLLRLLFARRGRPYGDTLAESLDELAAAGAGAVLAALAEQGVVPVAQGEALVPFRNRAAELAEWRDDRLEVEECAILGLFPQSSSDLLQDYDALLAELAAGAPPAPLLACARELLPPELREAIPPVATPAREGTPEPVPVVYADPSQRAVLTQARATAALVVDGPPGTGKSQVIVNLVADALARGERVAVVCEKRAALDVVVNRLEAQGLRHLLAVVHDVQEDRRPLYRQVVARLEDATERLPPGPALPQAAGEAAELTGRIARRTEALARRHQGLALGELHTYSAGLDAPADGQHPDLAALDPAAMERLAATLAPLRPYADLWRASSPWVHAGAARPSLAHADRDLLERIGQGLTGTAGLAGRVADLCARLGLTATAEGLAPVVRARVALQAVLDTRPVRADREAQAIFINLLSRALTGEGALAPLAGAEAAWAAAADAARTHGQPVRFPEDPETLAALDTVGRLHRSLLRTLRPAWRRAGKTLRAALLAHWPERAGHPLDAALVAAVRGRQGAARLWRTLEALPPLLGPGVSLPTHADGIGDWLARFATIGRQVEPLASLRPALQAAGAWPEALVAAALESWDAQVAERLKLLALHGRLGEATHQLARVFPWLRDWPGSADLLALAQAWQRDHPRLVESDRLLSRAQTQFPKSGHLVRHLSDREVPGDWGDLVRQGWTLAGIAQLEQAHAETRRLDRFTAAEAARTGERLGEVLDRHARLTIDALLARADRHPLRTAPQPGKGQRRSNEQATREALVKEAKKQRNLLPLRSFVRRFGEEGLLDLLPVWLLSPETMAVLFPRQPLFDLVIVDEASQCTVENGLAVLLRGKRVVIAGDEHQMPPTNFFRAGEAATDEADEDAEHRDLREMFDAESLLVLARARVPHAGLNWHYRCLHEELIAFSNHAIYGGGLKTIPSTASRTAPPALRWVHVEDGAYQDGANPAEARRVVDLMSELLQRGDRPSLGVVTFNLTQRRAILDEIDRRRSEDATFAAAFDAAMSRDLVDERPFVKNLESVQGDERDLILFSLGHAPQERARRDGRVERYVPARFGPLGQKGGERRLNVAISRAKREILVVASFDPVLLSVARSKHEGPRLFKQFLEYAHHLALGRRSQAERVLAMARGARPEQSATDRERLPGGYIPLKVQIALALEERGHRCELDVGTSGHRIPLAVLDPQDPGRYRLGILCEEGEQAPHPLESHVQVPRVLRARAWRTLTIDGRDWDRNRPGVLERIAAALVTD